MHNTIEVKSDIKPEDRLYKAVCIIGTGLSCACLVLAVLS